MIEVILLKGGGRARMMVRKAGRKSFYSVQLWGDGAVLADVYTRGAYRFCWESPADVARVALADWLDDHAADLDLPDHLKHEVGRAVREGMPDTITTA